jgi:hypothetical protein
MSDLDPGEVMPENNAPARIWLLLHEGEHGAHVWCDQPDPTGTGECEAVEYVRVTTDSNPPDFGISEMAQKDGPLVMRLLSRSDGLSQRAAVEIMHLRAELGAARADVAMLTRKEAQNGAEVDADHTPDHYVLHPFNAPPMIFLYRNHRDEMAERRVRPISVEFCEFPWLLDPQWVLSAVDLDGGGIRQFIMRDMLDVWFDGIARVKAGD